jgi:two-component system, OmpR family, heavy metal sensor histidine kinase CusS
MSYAESGWRRYWPAAGTLGRRLLVWYGATLLIVIAGVCATLYAALLHEVEWVDDQLLEKKFETVQTLILSESEREYWLNHEVSEDLEGPRRLFIRVIGPDGALLAETPGMAEIAPAGIFPQQRASTITGPDRHKLRALVQRASWRQGAGEQVVTVQMATDTTLDNVIYARYARALMLVVAVALFAGLVIGAVQLSRMLSPLNRIADQIAAVNLETLDQPIETEGLTGELSRLTSRFNAMMTRLGVSYSGVRYYADNVAHELRTPLNKLRMSLELALMRERSEGEYQETITQAAQDCGELSHLVERLLFLARASNKQASLSRQDVDLRAELEGVREYFEASAAESRVALTLDAAAGLSVSADRTLLQRAITNLVANALSHTPAGGSIALSARQVGEMAVIEVQDTGEGISAHDLPHVFERFYRGDAARTNTDGRVGLGLAIVKGIIELHGGWITLTSAPGQGAKATIGLPIAASNHVAHAVAAE